MKKGFTLLELLLVVAILAILAAAIGPNFVTSGKLTLEEARKQKFISNYQSITLAANMFLLASDTTMAIRNTSTYNPPTAPTTSGLGLLVASGVIQIDTTQYENVNGQARYFRMAVGPGGATNTGNASTSVQLFNGPAGTVITIPGATGNSIEAYLRTGGATVRNMSTLWDAIKAL